MTGFICIGTKGILGGGHPEEKKEPGRTTHPSVTLLFREGLSWAKNKNSYVLLTGRVQLFVTTRTVACQAPLSMEFSRQGAGCSFLLQFY